MTIYLLGAAPGGQPLQSDTNYYWTLIEQNIIYYSFQSFHDLRKSLLIKVAWSSGLPKSYISSKFDHWLKADGQFSLRKAESPLTYGVIHQSSKWLSIYARRWR